MSKNTESGGSQSLLTVVLALSANLGIAVLKGIAGALTGSSALLSEAAHSVGDSVTEVLLLTALRTSRKPADRTHPFGYGKERYFWSLLASVAIFGVGSMFSFYEGVRTLLGGGSEQSHQWVGYAVIAAGVALEGTSWSQSIRQIRQESSSEGRSFRAFLRDSDDPTVKTVFFEDAAALVGLALAALGLGLHQATGSAAWDGLASVAIGALLVVVALTLAQTNKALLIGKQVDPRMLRGIRASLADAPEIDAVVDLLTMMTGTDQVLLCARLDFGQALDSDAVERACVRIDGELREEFADLDEIFLEPVPRTNVDLRARVLQRYGDTFAG